MTDEKVLERLWDEYRDKHIKPDCEPDYLKTIAVIFYAGMFAMFKEFTEINKEVAQTLSDEFTEFLQETTDENKRGNNSSQ